MTQMKVQIRSPSLNQALEVSLELNSTVMNLKEEIQQAHPQHPLPSNQRIIFSGKLLNNDESLDTLINKLNQSGDSVVPIFHLVVKPSLLGSRQTPSSTTTSYGTNHTAQTSIHHPALSTDTATATTASSSASPMSNIQANTTFTNAPLYPPALPGGYQLVALNGQYYLAPVLVPAYNNTQQNTHAFMQTNTNSHFDHIGNQQQSPQRQAQYRRSSQQQAPRQQQQQQQQQAGAANRPALVRPANAQRAASIWLALKLYFVVFILCQGASLERILLFHAIALIMFMYQTGRLRIVVHRMRVVIQEPVERNPPPPNPPQQRQQHQQDGQNNNNNNSNNNNNNNPSEQNTPPSPSPPRATTTTSTTNSSPSSSSSSSSRTPQEPTTRLEVLKRGVYMFIASFWPNYGRDPRIAQAFENEQRQA